MNTSNTNAVLGNMAYDLKSCAEIMGTHKYGQGKSRTLYNNAQTRAANIIKKVEDMDIDVSNNPIYKQAYDSYTYWES